jgi:hypothetical protein
MLRSTLTPAAVPVRLDFLSPTGTLKGLRLVDENIYLRQSSINLFNGMVSLTFSCDGSHYMPHTQFLGADTAFWFGGVG